MKKLVLMFAMMASPTWAQDELLQQNVIDDQYPGQTVQIYGWGGEPKHVLPSRDNDETDPISQDTQTYWRAQPFQGAPLNAEEPIKIKCFPGESDIIRISILIDGKPDIVARHVNGDGTINWDGVAGENNAQHDHWPNAVGVVRIEGFDPAQDRVIATGHTVTDGGQFVAQGETQLRAESQGHDFDQFGELEAGIVTRRLYSQQGNGGGAHDEDSLGFVQFVGLDEAPKIETIGANVGVVNTYVEFLALVDYYESIEPEVDEDREAFVAFLGQYGFVPSDFPDDLLEWLFEWFIGRA